MGTISYTIPTAGSTLNSIAAPEVDSALQTLLTWANGNVDGANMPSSLTGRRLLMQATAILASGLAGGSYFINAAGGAAAPAFPSSSAALLWSMLDPAGFAVTGKSNTQLVVRMSVATNPTAPAITFNGELVAVTFGGGANSISATVGAQQGTSASVVTPAANSAVVTESSVFTFPAAGAYAPIINLSGALAANAAAIVTWQLFALNS